MDFLKALGQNQLSQEEPERVRSVDPFTKARLKSEANGIVAQGGTLEEFAPELLNTVAPELLDNPNPQEKIANMLELQTKEQRVRLELQSIFGAGYEQNPVALEILKSVVDDTERQQVQAMSVRKLDELRRI